MHVDMVVLRTWVLREELAWPVMIQLVVVDSYSNDFGFAVSAYLSSVCKSPLVSVFLGTHSADISERRLDSLPAEQETS